MSEHGGVLATPETQERQDLYLIRQWLKKAERESEPGAGRIMRPAEREALQRIIDTLVVSEGGVSRD